MTTSHRIAQPSRTRAFRSGLAALLVALGWTCLAAAGPASPGDLVLLAEAGEPEALLELAARHEHGQGVARDIDRALSLYCRAAAAGDPRAFYSIGWISLNGRGVDQSDAEAGWWLAAAAEQGHEQAARLLARLALTAAPEQTLCPAWYASRTVEAPAEVREIVTALAPAYRLDPELVLAVIKIESAFNPRAVSPKNAQGLMQLIPETARRFQVSDPFDPVQNIRGGMAYLRWLIDFFGGDVELALAGYNAGENAVLRHGGIPPYRETESYVVKVRALHREG